MRECARSCGEPAWGTAASRFSSRTWLSTARGHLVFRGERRVELTRTEFQLLELFMRNVGQVLTRAVIFDRVWDTCTGPSRRQPRTRDRSPGRRGTRRHCGGE